MGGIIIYPNLKVDKYTLKTLATFAADNDDFKGDDILNYYGWDRVLIGNWRVVKQVNNNIFVTTNTCDTFKIHNLSLKEFHQVNDEHTTIKRVFEYIDCMLVCTKCHGKGTLTWVDDITNNVETYKNMYQTYKRNPNIKIRSINSYFVSTPILNESKGAVFCKLCNKTGLHSFEIKGG